MNTQACTFVRQLRDAADESKMNLSFRLTTEKGFPLEAISVYNVFKVSDGESLATVTFSILPHKKDTISVRVQSLSEDYTKDFTFHEEREPTEFENTTRRAFVSKFVLSLQHADKWNWASKNLVSAKGYDSMVVMEK